MDFVLGMIGGVLVIAAFIAGVLVAERVRAAKQPAAPAQTTEELYGMSAEEIKKHRDELKAVQQAFHATQTYSAETAYGIGGKDEIEQTLGM